METKYINIKGELVDCSSPLVMGVMNLTPDSFYQESRQQTDTEIAGQVFRFMEEGADIIDVGGYSSRPGSTFVDEVEEWKRLKHGLDILFRVSPDAIVSVDTFRSGIARRCVGEFGVALINDISAGEMDRAMFATVADLGVPYILMHMRGNVQSMMWDTNYDQLLQELFLYFSGKIKTLRQLGVKDLIIDPGFGFSKDTDQNYYLLSKLEEFRIFELPILVGISRKTMIREVLECEPNDALNGTTVLNTIAMMKGANIVRVHDVKEAVQSVRLIKKLKENAYEY